MEGTEIQKLAEEETDEFPHVIWLIKYHTLVFEPCSYLVT